MRTIIITFTHEGMKVAKKASEAMDGEVIIYCHQRCADTYKNEAVPFVAVGSVIKSEFAVSDRILFVCAVAIAVRTIAPYLKSKVTDPAVLVADEGGKYLISLLSGHIGRANEWCSKLAVRIGAMPVITTATDARGMFAVDIFATEHNMRIVNPVMIKDISGRILNNEPVGITGNDKYKNLLKVTEERWNGQIKYTDNSNNEYESGVQIITGKDDKIVFKRTLKLVPQELAVGIGCKKGKSAHEIERAVKKTFDKAGLLLEGVAPRLRARRSKLRILPSAASGRVHTLRCFSSPNQNRFAGFRFGIRDKRSHLRGVKNFYPQGVRDIRKR